MRDESFDKDSWVRLAFSQRHISCDRNGNIYRNAGKNPDGTIIWKKVALQTHKKSGRVYWNLTFRNLTKSVLVNRAVALRFLPNPENKLEVNHKDGVKAHNWVDNLEWASRSEQEKHAFRTGLKATRGSSNSNAKLTAGDVLAIRHLYEGGATINELARVYPVSIATIRSVVARTTWSHI